MFKNIDPRYAYERMSTINNSNRRTEFKISNDFKSKTNCFIKYSLSQFLYCYYTKFFTYTN